MIHKLTRNNSLCWPRISLLLWQKNKNKYLKTTKLSFSLYVHPYFTSIIKCTFYGSTTYVRNMLISKLAVRFCDVNRISHIEETKGYKNNMVGKWGNTGLGRRKKWGLGCSTNTKRCIQKDIEHFLWLSFCDMTVPSKNNVPTLWAWPLTYHVNFFQWIDNDPISIRYEFQIDISNNSWEIKYQNMGICLLHVKRRKGQKWR